MQLIKQKHIMIDWKFYQYPVYDWDTNKLIEKRYAIHLTFTMQVNWELKRIEESFPLEDIANIDTPKDSPNCCDPEYSLEDWSSWYMLLRILKELWYDIARDEWWEVRQSIILDWIEKCREEYKDNIEYSN